jgi:hypothetical protein
MTTITKFAVLTSTVTNNIIELITRTETETESITRHSTRTIQIVSTSTTRLTVSTTETRTVTSTTYSLVPYTITEVETQTRTIENVILTTFTIPASTIHKTHYSTLTQSAHTVTMTELLQPMIETVATETVFATTTVTTASVETVTVKVDVPIPVKLVEEEPSYADDRQYVSPSEFERLFDSDLQVDVPLPADAGQQAAEERTEHTKHTEHTEQDGLVGEDTLAVSEDGTSVEGAAAGSTMQQSETQHSADLNDYPVASSEQSAAFEFVSHLPSGAEVINPHVTEAEESSEEAETETPVADRRVLAALQHWPFMGAAQRAGGRIY